MNHAHSYARGASIPLVHPHFPRLHALTPNFPPTLQNLREATASYRSRFLKEIRERQRNTLLSVCMVRGRRRRGRGGAAGVTMCVVEERMHGQGISR